MCSYSIYCNKGQGEVVIDKSKDLGCASIVWTGCVGLRDIITKATEMALEGFKWKEI